MYSIPSVSQLRSYARHHQAADGDFYSLAVALAERGDFAKAVSVFQSLVVRAPDNPAWRSDLADALSEVGNVSAAVAEYRAALALTSDRGDIWFKLARLLDKSADDKSEARRMYVRSVACDPQSIAPYLELCRSTLRHSSAEEAAAAVRTLLAGSGKAESVDVAIAQALHELGRVDECIECCDRILNARPDDVSALFYRGQCRIVLRNVDAATADISELLRRHPHSELAGWTMVQYHITFGRWEEAQRIFSSLRADLCVTKGGDPPMWDGAHASGATVLVENRLGARRNGLGLGDHIQGGRFYRLAQERGVRIVAEYPEALVDLMRSVPGIASVARPFERSLTVRFRSVAFDIGLMLAPHGFGGNAPYVSVSPLRLAKWQRHVADEDPMYLRVGVAWAANDTVFSANPYRCRTIPLEALRPLTTIPWLRLYSLQFGPEIALLNRMSPPMSVIEIGSKLADFADLAATMKHLDLVISVDTSVAHLAGALHHPCWVLLPYAPDWRWGVEGHSTSWYSSHRLFRQSRPGKWDAVIADVSAALHQLVDVRRNVRSDNIALESN
jgi:tetratricopeptide (TPR) repeat protein